MPMRSLATAALVAAGMYWFDRTSGRRRRARLRDQLVSGVFRLDHGLEVARRDLAHRMQGLAARARSMFRDDYVDDEVLEERVRSCLGRVVSHPGAIEVSSDNGHVVLSGDVLTHEHGQLIRAVDGVHGVAFIEDQLAIHASAEGISALQGGRPRQPRRFELMQDNWSPGARLLTSLAGSALVIQGLRGRGLLGMLTAAAGSVLLARTAMNMPLRQIAGASTRRVIDLRKTLHVNAPLEQVFETLAHHEHFPAFMRNVRRVRLHEDGRSHWTVAGPGGVPVEFDSIITRLEPNTMVAWRTVPNSSVEHAGSIQFEPANTGTRLTIRMSYKPPAGALGHVVARLFGADPKTEMDEDMARMKTFLETGKRARDAAGREEVTIRRTVPEETGTQPMH
jgi:uncharacterized membrane protein